MFVAWPNWPLVRSRVALFGKEETYFVGWFSPLCCYQHLKAQLQDTHRALYSYKILYFIHTDCVGGESSVGIATCYGLDGPIIISRLVARFTAPVQTGPGAHTAPVQWIPGLLPGEGG